jgi:hypothetical protein
VRGDEEDELGVDGLELPALEAWLLLAPEGWAVEGRGVLEPAEESVDGTERPFIPDGVAEGICEAAREFDRCRCCRWCWPPAMAEGVGVAIVVGWADEAEVAVAEVSAWSAMRGGVALEGGEARRCCCDGAIRLLSTDACAWEVDEEEGNAGDGAIQARVLPSLILPRFTSTLHYPLLTGPASRTPETGMIKKHTHSQSPFLIAAAPC